MSAPKSTTAFFGQAWELEVGYYGPDNELLYETITTNEWEPEALHITFEVQQATIESPWWYADIVIYNLDAETVGKLVYNAAWTTLKAGFQTNPTLASVIWDGPILQVLYDQENVVDQRLTLHCQANPLVSNDGVVSFSLGVNSTQARLLARAAAEINLPEISQQQGTLSAYAQNVLNLKAYPRGNTVFGKYGNFMSIVANDQALQTFRDGYQTYMTELGAPGSAAPTPDFIFSPPNPPGVNLPLPSGTTPTIIGTPRQTPQGVVFTVLLDPRVKVKLPPQVVQLVRALPSQLAIQPNPSAGNMATPLNSDLTFFLAQVRHSGDSRGNTWYTEITGYSTTYAKSLLDGIFSASSNGG